jgi:hypothetical protein
MGAMMSELSGPGAVAAVAAPPKPAVVAPAETKTAALGKSLSKMVFGLIPRKLGSSHFWFQLTLLGPVLVFFILLMVGVLPAPQKDVRSGYDVIAEVGAAIVAPVTATEPSYAERFRDLKWVRGGGLTTLMTWWSIFALSISASCWGLLLSHASRDGFKSSEVEDGSLIYSMRYIGTIFGVLIVLIFLGGFVAGSLFPSFAGVSFRNIYFEFSDPSQWARLLLWAFIAGFAERLIPNLLNAFAKRLEQAAGDAEK